MEDETIDNPVEEQEELLIDSDNPVDDNADETVDPFGQEYEEDKEEPSQGVDDDEAILRDMIKKETAGTANEVQSLRRQLEVQTYLTNNPEYREYADQISRVALDKRTRGLTMDAVVAATLGTKKIAQIATKEAEASRAKADASRTVGTTKRTSEVESDWVKSLGEGTQEDWNRVINEAKMGKFVK